MADPTQEGQEAPAQQQQQQQQYQVQVDDSNCAALYANFCRVTGSPEELIVDFGLNPQPVGVPTQPIKVSQRVILNFFTAKRLLNAPGPVGAASRIRVRRAGDGYPEAAEAAVGTLA